MANCTKKPFLTYADAVSAMNIVPEWPSGKRPNHVYHCNICKTWHYSSKNQIKRRRRHNGR